MRTRSAALTDRGLREQNEDAHLAWDAHGVYAIADGMGGYAAGEEASAIAVNAVATAARLGKGPWPYATLFDGVHKAILAKGAQRGKGGMGTTLTVLRLFDGRAEIAHVGDCRCYRVRNGAEVERLTRDHSVGHRLLNCLGHSPDSFGGPDSVTRSARLGDVFVLASDGLASLSALDIRRALHDAKGAELDLPRAAQALIRTALARDGKDNATVVVVEVL